MRKLIFCVLIATYFCSSCNLTHTTAEEDVLLINNTSTDATVAVGARSYTIAANNTAHGKMTWGESVSLQDTSRRTAVAQYDYSDGNALKITIADMQSYSYTVSNRSTHDIILSEANNMLTDTYGGTVSVAAGEDKQITVYTTNPSFVAAFTVGSENAHKKVTVSGAIVTIAD
ncbi:MAG: hypothetical protein J6I73_05170 [Treponema sp.]|nr:hypothetical protein [Treponema sp.]